MLGTGIGLAIGLPIGLLLSCISKEGWVFIGDWLAFVGDILECCSAFSVLSLGLSTMVIMFVFGHHLWLSLFAGVGIMGLAIFTLTLAVRIDRIHIQADQALRYSSSSAPGCPIK